MPNAHGEWTWFELLTTDPDAATRFYGDVVGWTVRSADMPGTDYRLIHVGDEAVAGLMTMPDGMGSGPTWLGYVGVDDVDESVAAIEAAGGTTHMPATTIPGVGRIAMLTDPQGSAFYVMRGESDERSTAFAEPGPGATGHTVWTELSAPDPDAALPFYTGIFGWRQEGGMPMGELGDYRFLHAGSISFGALMGVPPGAPPGWHYYFQVPDIDVAARRVGEGGGIVVQGPDEIPGGAFAVVARDPQGATFGLVGARNSGESE